MRKTFSTRGALIVLEGPDGVGKTSLSKAIEDHFRESPEAFLSLSFPGREPGTLGKLVYDVHHDSSHLGVEEITEFSKQVLHIAAHIDSIERTIRPALDAGRNVLLDRFWWSAWVYGVVDGLDRPRLKKLIDLERSFWKNYSPTAIFLIERDNPIDRNVDSREWSSLSHEYNVLAEREREKGKQQIFRTPNAGSFAELSSAVIETITTVLLSEKKRPKSDRTSRQTPTQPAIDFEIPTVSGIGIAAPTIIASHIRPAKPTIVFDTYWKFAVERQNIFFKRQKGEPGPWTEDPVLRKYKFTNAYRASDRVSQFLIRDVIYNPELSNEGQEVFFRIILFKLFNKIETWNLLRQKLGPISYKDFDARMYDRILTDAMSRGNAIYSGAYIMPSGGKHFGLDMKHRTHLKLVDMMMKDELFKKIADSKKMQHGFEMLRAYPSIGDFLAYQFIVDINYSELTNYRESEFVVPGPGSLDGIRKCFTDRGGLSESELIKFVTDIQEQEFERLGLKFSDLWGRSLQLIDCQNLFCEVDKYARVMHPAISGITGRTRIKQTHKPNYQPIDFWYPPKWEINEAIAKGTGASKTRKIGKGR